MLTRPHGAFHAFAGGSFHACHSPRVTTTKRDKEARPAPDLVDRDCTATAPNQLWVTDITFTPTAAGFLHLAVVLNAWSRKPDAERQSEIVGWSMANHLRAELVVDALEMALGQRRPHNVILHSDLGSQHTSLAFGKRCKEAKARMACFDFIEGRCNPVRLHSGLGYRSPNAYETVMEMTIAEP